MIIIDGFNHFPLSAYFVSSRLSPYHQNHTMLQDFISRQLTHTLYLIIIISTYSRSIRSRRGHAAAASAPKRQGRVSGSTGQIPNDLWSASSSARISCVPPRKFKRRHTWISLSRVDARSRLSSANPGYFPVVDTRFMSAMKWDGPASGRYGP